MESQLAFAVQVYCPYCDHEWKVMVFAESFHTSQLVQCGSNHLDGKGCKKWFAVFSDIRPKISVCELGKPISQE
jgi:hypothetical protein